MSMISKTFLHILCRISSVNINYEKKKLIYHIVGSSWSWYHGGWIYNYLYNQYLSPLKLWVRIPLMA